MKLSESDPDRHRGALVDDDGLVGCTDTDGAGEHCLVLLGQDVTNWHVLIQETRGQLVLDLEASRAVGDGGSEADRLIPLLLPKLA